MALTTPAAPARPIPASSPIVGLMWAARISARQFLTGPRKWIVLLAGAVFPGLLSVFTFFEKGELLHPFLQLFDQLYLQGVILFMALLGAIPAFSSDVEDGTITYLFARPTPRPLLVVGKWLGAMVPLLVVALLPVLAAWPMALRQQQPYTRTVMEPVAAAKPDRTAEPPPDEHRGGGTAVETHAPVSERVQYHAVSREFPSQRHKPEAKHLGMALLATSLGVLEYGTLFFALGVVFGRPYMIALSYAVIFEVIIGRTPVKFYVLSKFIRGAAVRTLDPVPSYFKGSLETVPSEFVSWAALVVIPLVILGGAALVASRRSYVSKGV